MRLTRTNLIDPLTTAYTHPVDPLSQLLDAPRAKRAFLLRMHMRPPWSLEVRDEAPLTLIPVLAGRVWVRSPRTQPCAAEPGDIVLAATRGGYVVSSEPWGVPNVRIGPEQTCTARDGLDLSDALHTGVRWWGNDPEGPDRMLVGTYRSATHVGSLALQGLPEIAVVRDADRALIGLLGDEVSRERSGQQCVLDRLLDLLLVTTLRAWTEDQAGHGPGWLAAQADPLVAATLRSMHAEPERPWVMDELAERVHVSRATLARRFTDAVGMAPMSYLTQCRLALAADLLDDPAMTVETVSRTVGYASPYSFSAAFKRHHGLSPRAHRNRTQ